MSIGAARASGGAGMLGELPVADFVPHLAAGLGLAWNDLPMGRWRSREMVGRDRELALLRGAADRARSGQPGLVLVTGEAGIGKTRLVRELEEQVPDGLVLTGHGVDLATGGLPFGVLADTLADLVRKRGAAIVTDAERQLLGPVLPGPVVERSDPARVLAGAAALFDRLAREDLVCWVVEDLQWADDATRDLVSVLGRRQSGRLLVVATARTEALGELPADANTLRYLDELGRLPAADTVLLHRLGTDDVRRLLAGLLDEPLPAEVVRDIVKVGDGVPFVVEELAAARGRPGLSSVAAVAEARLGALPGGARRLVEAAAMGEGQLVWPLLEAVVELGPDELDEAVLAAVRTGVMEETPGHEGLRFRHALLRDAADRSIPPAARRAWHRRWAAAITGHPGVLPPDPALIAVAHHWHHAGDPERSALAALAATDAARRTGGGPEELALWDRLLELWPVAGRAVEKVGVTHYDVIDSILGLAITLGGDRRTLDLVDRAEAAAEDEVEQIAIRLRRIRGARAKGDFLPAIAEMTPERRRRWEAVLRAALPEAGAIARNALAQLAYLDDLGSADADRLLAEVRELARAAGDERAVLRTYAHQAWRSEAQGQPELAVDYLTQVLETTEVESTFDLWAAEGNLIWSLSILGRYDEAQGVIARAMNRLPDPHSVGANFEHIVENAAFGWINTGQWARAEELIVTAKPYWSDGPRTADLRLAEIQLLRLGRLDDVGYWRTAIDVPPFPGGAVPRSIAETVAWHAAFAGDLGEMRKLLEPSWTEAGVGAVDWKSVLWALRFEADAATRRPDPGDRAAAESHVVAIETTAGQLYRLGDLGVAWDAEVSAQLARFRGEPCGPLLRAAVAAWNQVGHPYDAAVAQLCLAEAEVADDRDAARRHAEESLARAKELGAAPLARDVEEFLKRYRLASRQVWSAGKPGSLTARELEVLAVLAEGRTNEQIAAELYMSPKTASVHVSRIIAKLGAANRTEAAAVARRIGLL